MVHMPRVLTTEDTVKSACISWARKGSSGLGGTPDNSSLFLPGPAEPGRCTKGLAHLGSPFRSPLPLEPNLLVGLHEHM